MEVTASNAASVLPQAGWTEEPPAPANTKAADDLLAPRRGMQVANTAVIQAGAYSALALTAAAILAVGYKQWLDSPGPEAAAKAIEDAAGKISGVVSKTARAMRPLGMNLPQPSVASLESSIADMFAAAKSGQVAVSDFGHRLVEAIKQPQSPATKQALGWVDPATGVFSESDATGIPVVLDRGGVARGSQPFASIEGDDGGEIKVHIQRGKTADGKEIVHVTMGGGGPGKEPKDLAKKIIEALCKATPNTLLAGSIAGPFLYSDHKAGERDRLDIRPNFSVGNPSEPTVNAESYRAIDGLSSSSSPEDIRAAYKNILDLHYDEVVDTMRDARWHKVLGSVPGTGGPMFTDADVQQVQQLRQAHLAAIDRIVDPAKETLGVPGLPNGVGLSGNSFKQMHLTRMLDMLDANLRSLQPSIVSRLAAEPAAPFDTQPLNVEAFARTNGLQLSRQEDAKKVIDAVYRHHIRQAVDSPQSGLNERQRGAVLHSVERWLAKDPVLDSSQLPRPPVGGSRFDALMNLALRNAALNVGDLSKLTAEVPPSFLDQLANKLNPEQVPNDGAQQQASVIDGHRKRMDERTASILAGVNELVGSGRTVSKLRDVDLKMTDFLPPGVEAPGSEAQRQQALDRFDALRDAVQPQIEALWQQSNEVAALTAKPQWQTQPQAQSLATLSRDLFGVALEDAQRLEQQLRNIEYELLTAPLAPPAR